MRHIYDREVIEENLERLKPLNYNRFMWWRSHTRKNKLLSNYAPLIQRIKNGDYDRSIYFWQAQLATLNYNEAYQANIATGQGDDKLSLMAERCKRLWEDFEKDEAKLLIEIRKEFCKLFRISIKAYERIMDRFDGTLEDLYYYCEKKYKND